MVPPMTMKAAVLVKANDVQVKEVDTPEPAAGQARIRVVAVAQNPVDWMDVEDDKTGTAGAFVGCDFAGIVDALGSEYPNGAPQLGERVAGIVHGSHYVNHGSFAEYLVTDALFLIRVPSSVSFENAASISAGTMTTMQMFYQSLKLPYKPSSPSTKREPILIWSGATSVGHYAVQFAKIIGLTVIVTASSKHHDYMKLLGADAVFDYKDADAPKKIKEYTKGQLEWVADCISEYDSPQKTSEALSDKGGVVAAILPYETVRPEVIVNISWAVSLFGQLLPEYGISETHLVQAREYAEIVSQALQSPGLKFPPPRIFPKGLASVPEGLAFQKAGKVSGEKITFRIADTMSRKNADDSNCEISDSTTVISI